MATKTQKLNVSKLSDDDLQDMFTEAYEKKVAKENEFDSFECICKRSGPTSDVKMEVTVTGMAGSPTIDDYKNGKVKNSKEVVIEREGKGSLMFKLLPKETISLNTNDYLVIYQAE
jgi:hypothetical protein